MEENAEKSEEKKNNETEYKKGKEEVKVRNSLFSKPLHATTAEVCVQETSNALETIINSVEDLTMNIAVAKFLTKIGTVGTEFIKDLAKISPRAAAMWIGQFSPEAAVVIIERAEKLVNNPAELKEIASYLLQKGYETVVKINEIATWINEGNEAKRLKKEYKSQKEELIKEASTENKENISETKTEADTSSEVTEERAQS